MALKMVCYGIAPFFLVDYYQIIRPPLFGLVRTTTSIMKIFGFYCAVHVGYKFDHFIYIVNLFGIT